jgi:hypothetical protein
MSATAGLWALLAVALILLSPRRPVYAVSFYLMTFFAAPHLWWWGNELPELRYAGIAGLLLLAVVLINQQQTSDSPAPRFSIAYKAALAMAVNATVVHYVLATSRAISYDNYVELLKLVLFSFVMGQAIRNRDDLRVVMMSIAAGTAYIGYEIYYNERGYFDGGRLEGVGAPGADSSNSLADLMLVCIPLIGSLFVAGTIWNKVVAVVAAPLALNVILLCNSRGGFLGLAGAAGAFVLVARGATRKKALQSLALGGLALFLLLGDPEIVQRFATTFAGDEERDRSAASRLEFWQAGLRMLNDYPLGDGGNSFKHVHGGRYISQVIGEDAVDRSLHNGYLTEATEWGIQGLILRLIFVGSALVAAYRTSNRARREGRMNDALLGICFIVAVAGFLIHCLFGSFLSNEWGYWVVPILLRYSELYGVPEAAVATAAVDRPPATPSWTVSSATAPNRS